ncbi:hypothetical protein NDU88_005782 [Pleurodeles waltl]|uniref:Uncharacterized protein n=1 Tax=Pleurodeles waltl TaxID=8319 RepID=A0AAV7TWC3_PLEWA|nr:hypothetical protein NDU88_005782 [Pleurodeles waltl]
MGLSYLSSMKRFETWMDGMERTNVDNLRAELKRLFKERGLNVGKKDSKVDLQIALQAHEEVKRMQAATKEDDPEGDLEPD